MSDLNRSGVPPMDMQMLLRGGVDPENPFSQPSPDPEVRGRQFAMAQRFISSFGDRVDPSHVSNYVGKNIDKNDRLRSAIGLDGGESWPGRSQDSLRRDYTSDTTNGTRRPKFRTAFTQAIGRYAKKVAPTEVQRNASRDNRTRAVFRKRTGKKMQLARPLTRRERRGRRHGRNDYTQSDPDYYMLPSGYALENMLYPMMLHYDAVVTTDGSGVWATVYSNLVANAPNWSSFAVPFEQYRVAKFIVRFEPLKQYGGGTAITFAPVATVVDRDDGTALTGYSLSDRYGSQKIIPGNQAWRKTYLSTGINELGFVDCATPVTDAWIKVYSSGNTASTTIGRVFITYYVVFKGMGIT